MQIKGPREKLIKSLKALSIAVKYNNNTNEIVCPFFVV